MRMLPFIFDVKKFAVHDGPGIRTTYFLKGCSLRCKWCHNPESFSIEQQIAYNPLKCIGCGACRMSCANIGEDLLVERDACTLCGNCIKACKAGARKWMGRTISPEELRNRAKREKLYYETSGGGVTFSGGECMLYPDYIAACATLLKSEGITVVIDTCGNVPIENFKRIEPLVDLFLYDIKKIDSKAHAELTGAGNERILENLKYLCGKGAGIIIRVPLIPGLTDAVEDMEKIADFILVELSGKIERVELLPYNKLAGSKYGNNTIFRGGGVGKYTLPDLEPQTKEYVASLNRIFEEKHIAVFSEVL